METMAFITAILIIVIYSVFRSPNFKNKEEIIITYPNGLGSGWQRKRKEKKILKAGYKIISEEEMKEWGIERLIYIVIPIFLPLAFFKSKKIKVTYKKLIN